MSELRSKCCGAGAERAKPWLLSGADRLFNYICESCGYPCEVEEKDHDEEWKNARDAYSGEREEE